MSDTNTKAAGGKAPKRRKFFDCIPGTDGCDETFDIISRTTGQRVAWAGFWEDREPCRRAATALTIALNAAFASRRIDFDVAYLAHEQQQIAIVWRIDDVLYMRPDLTEAQAWEVLQLAEQRHHESLEFSRDSIRMAANDLYGCAPERRR